MSTNRTMKRSPAGFISPAGLRFAIFEMIRSHIVPQMLAEECDLEGDTDEKRKKVGRGLRCLHACKAQKVRQNEDERQEADALT